MNLFIAGVGNVELFKGKESVLVSKTLVDSSINLSVSLEDIRAGAGAKLYGKYAHSSGMTMKLTDAMFRMEFLAANIGADIVDGGTAVGTTTKVVNGGAIDISDINAQPIYPGADVRVWAGKKAVGGAVEYKLFSDIEGNTVAVGEYFSDGDELCVRYIKSNDAGETLTVSANFIPDTMTAILTAPLFAGDNNNLEASTKVGTLTITIPRFMLNGTTDLSMSMTGATQMTLEGSALAVESEDCDGDGYYAIVSKVLTNAKITDGLATIGVVAFDERDEIVGQVLTVMGMYTGIGAKKIPATAVEVTGEGVLYNANTGVITLDAGAAETVIAVTVSMKENAEISTVFEIPAIE
jgi:hypothetical protein